MKRFTGLLMAGLAGMSMPVQAQVYVGSVQVIDGDTLDMGGTRLRLFAIDAVEATQMCDRRSESWACGKDATLALAGLINDRQLSCTAHDVVSYGRIVASCSVGRYDLGQQMVQMGYAVALVEFSDR